MNKLQELLEIHWRDAIDYSTSTDEIQTYIDKLEDMVTTLKRYKRGLENE